HPQQRRRQNPHPPRRLAIPRHLRPRLSIGRVLARLLGDGGGRAGLLLQLRRLDLEFLVRLLDDLLVEVRRLRRRLPDEHQQPLRLFLALQALFYRQVPRLLRQSLAELLRRLLREAPPALRAQQQVQRLGRLGVL